MVKYAFHCFPYFFVPLFFVVTMSNVEVKVDEKQRVEVKSLELQNNELISDLAPFTPQFIVPDKEIKITPKVEILVLESGKLTNSKVVLFCICNI